MIHDWTAGRSQEGPASDQLSTEDYNPGQNSRLGHQQNKTKHQTAATTTTQGSTSSGIAANPQNITKAIRRRRIKTGQDTTRQDERKIGAQSGATDDWTQEMGGETRKKEGRKNKNTLSGGLKG